MFGSDGEVGMRAGLAVPVSLLVYRRVKSRESNEDCSIGPGFCYVRDTVIGLCKEVCDKRPARCYHSTLIVLRGRTWSRRLTRCPHTIRCLVAVYTGGRDSPFSEFLLEVGLNTKDYSYPKAEDRLYRPSKHVLGRQKSRKARSFRRFVVCCVLFCVSETVLRRSVVWIGRRSVGFAWLLTFQFVLRTPSVCSPSVCGRFRCLNQDYQGLLATNSSDALVVVKGFRADQSDA